MWGSFASPWYVHYEFVRQISCAFVVTFGPRRAPGTRRWESLRIQQYEQHAAETVS